MENSKNKENKTINRETRPITIASIVLMNSIKTGINNTPLPKYKVVGKQYPNIKE
jgi:hypothetical protein